jgi:hypothetical protein
MGWVCSSNVEKDEGVIFSNEGKTVENICLIDTEIDDR